MKTDRTESAHILQMCRLLAVAHPEVAFSLIEDGREVFRTPACPDRLQRVREIFGRRRAEDLLSIDYEANGLRVSGLVGRPNAGRSTRAEMITYVNNRPVESRALSYALIESYHRYLPRGRYPVAFLFVDVPAGEVDVNVHPTKKEVRFRAESLVRSAVMTGLADILGKESRKRFEPVEKDPGSEAPDAGQKVAAKDPNKAIPPRPAILPDKPVPVRTFPETPTKPLIVPQHQKPKSVIETAGPIPGTPEIPARRPAPSAQGSPAWTFCGSYRRNVGIFESPDGLVLLNCRAARERILFEQIESGFQGEQIPRQALLIPSMLELPPLEGSLLGEQLDFFNSIGFEIEPFGRHMFRIRAVPGWMHAEGAIAFVEDLLHKIRERGIRPNERQPAQSLVARIAATREARGFSVKEEQEWLSLLEQLLACENPLLDARGRPTFVEMRHGEIARKLMLDRVRDESDRLD
jgi:DNA mismatch repair protein MutL